MCLSFFIVQELSPELGDLSASWFDFDPLVLSILLYMEILDPSSVSRIFFCIFLSVQLSYCSLFFCCVQMCMPALKQVKKSCSSHTLM